jgi:hypothetical protein
MIPSSRANLELVVTEVTKDMLVANLASRNTMLISETGLSIELKSKSGLSFFIPQPLMDNRYYTVGQLEEIETSLSGVSVELHPIDYNLC